MEGGGGIQRHETCYMTNTYITFFLDVIIDGIRTVIIGNARIKNEAGASGGRGLESAERTAWEATERQERACTCAVPTQVRRFNGISIMRDGNEGTITTAGKALVTRA